MGRVDAAYKPTATIAINTAVSNAVDISKLSMRGLSVKVPSAWTAAVIGFQVSDKATEPTSDDATWSTLYKTNNDGDDSEPIRIVGIATNEARVYLVPPEIWMAGNYRWLRLVSRDTNTFATPVNQAAARTLVLGTLA
jgi:hypothetical protein